MTPLKDGNQKYAIRSKADIVCLTGGTGSGKAQPLDEPILSTKGWIKMGDIRIGEELVSPLNNEPSIVTGIYPQGIKPIYRITTSDGRTTRCCGEHLWMVRTNTMVQKHRKNGTPSFYVKTTKEIIRDYISRGKSIFIPVAKAVEYEHKDLPIDPYVLGVWLGDGIKGCCTLTISNYENDIIERVADRLGATFHLHGKTNFHNTFHRNNNTLKMQEALKEYGLDVYSGERFIPNDYLHSSVEQRMDLLKGLMDSDGNIDQKHRLRFFTTSAKLKDCFVDLCRGLGYVVSINKDNRTYARSDAGWTVRIHTNDVIFRSQKHFAKHNAFLEKVNNNRCVYANDHIKITNIEYIGDMEAQCIMVSNKDHLYITKDYIVTHNTVALYYAPIEYLTMNDNAKIVCFMRNVTDFWGSGKVADTLKKMYPLVDRSIKKQPHDPIGEIIRNQVDMGMKLYNGSEIKFQQLDNENPIVIDKIAKGLQAKKLIFDECNKFQWRTITSFMPRLRADSSGKAQIFLAQNPERNCFMRKLCGKGEHGGGWINDDGSVDKSMDGVVMYFNMQEGRLDKTYFGRTKKEVYEKCKDHIDAMLEKDPDMTYEDFILSMVFFTFDVRDNKKMLSKNKAYRGLAANSATAKSAHEGNWNYSIEDDEIDESSDLSNSQVSTQEIEYMFKYEPRPQNSELLKKFVTVDMATTGFDNMVMKYWELWSHYGYLCRDIKYSVKNGNLQAVRMIQDFCNAHNVTDKNLIIDTQGFQFLRECFPSCHSFSGATQVSNRGKNQFRSMKDESAHLAMEMIKSGLIHYDPELANMRYTHQNMKTSGGTTVMQHMKFESVIFQFDKTPSGKITVIDKVDQKKMIKGMSPDLTDNIIMLCGATCYDCYRMLRDDAGVSKKRMSANSFIDMLGVNEVGLEVDTRIHKVQKIRNASEILNVLSTI